MSQTAITVTGTPTGTTGSDGLAVFTISTAVTNEDVYVDRLHQKVTTDYVIVGTTITFQSGSIPLVGALIEVYGLPLGSISATSPTAVSKTGFVTAGTIINRCASQLGLLTTLPSSAPDPYGSTDPNMLQLCELLNMLGEDLQSKHEWGHFIKEATIATASLATAYALPADFYRVIDQTEWNRSTRFAMLGPLSGQETQYLKARLSGVLIQVAYRIQGNVINFPIAPANSQTLAFEYMSSYWVWSAAGTQPDSIGAVATGDTVLYEQDLAIAGLKLAYLEAKGFDSTIVRERFIDILDASISKNIGSRILSMGGIGVNADHLIDAQNLPITGYAGQ